MSRPKGNRFYHRPQTGRPDLAGELEGLAMRELVAYCERILATRTLSDEALEQLLDDMAIAAHNEALRGPDARPRH